MRIRIIDAFTDRPFAGNPAGVCLLDAGPWPGEAWMPANLPTTSYARSTWTSIQRSAVLWR
jgi:predicted PhzF superfamily epimerase YddE/YHI9